jgi:SHAQKYF class myb-like DNA-binding protein
LVILWIFNNTLHFFLLLFYRSPAKMTTSGTVGEATQHPVGSPTSSSSSPQSRSGSFGNEKESSRLKWTPELHQLFLDSVKILAASNDTVTPNNILRVMTERINTYDVPKFQLTRTHIASHLQKYRIDVRLHTLEASSAAAGGSGGGIGGGGGGGQAVITNSPSPATSGNPRTHSVFKFTMMDPKKDAAAAAATTSSSVPESPNPPSPSKLLSQSPPPPLAHHTAEDSSSEVDTNSVSH